MTYTDTVVIMKTAYEPGSTVEAYMLQDYLKQEGIPVEVYGASLTGAVGELPAAGLVRLVVEEEHYERAREAIKRWEAQEVRSPAPTPAPAAPGASWSALTLMGGALAGLALGYVLFRAPVTTEGFDHNGDGKPDEFWKRSVSGRTMELRLDRNFDGNVDAITQYNEAGRPESTRSDDNFDGKFETSYWYALGSISRGEVDTDGDAIANVKMIYERGVLQSLDIVDPYTGRAVRREYYALGLIDHADIDSRRTGNFDKRVFYSPQQEIVRIEDLR